MDLSKLTGKQKEYTERLLKAGYEQQPMTGNSVKLRKGELTLWVLRGGYMRFHRGPKPAKAQSLSIGNPEAYLQALGVE